MIPIKASQEKKALFSSTEKKVKSPPVQNLDQTREKSDTVGSGVMASVTKILNKYNFDFDLVAWGKGLKAKQSVLDDELSITAKKLFNGREGKTNHEIINVPLFDSFNSINKNNYLFFIRQKLVTQFCKNQNIK